MSTMSIAEFQAKLPELLGSLQPGDDLIITRNQQPLARVTYAGPMTRQPRRAGSAKGKLVIVAEDEEHLEDFHEYMP